MRGRARRRGRTRRPRSSGHDTVRRPDHPRRPAEPLGQHDAHRAHRPHRGNDGHGRIPGRRDCGLPGVHRRGTQPRRGSLGEDPAALRAHAGHPPARVVPDREPLLLRSEHTAGHHLALDQAIGGQRHQEFLDLRLSGEHGAVPLLRPHRQGRGRRDRDLAHVHEQPPPHRRALGGEDPHHRRLEGLHRPHHDLRRVGHHHARTHPGTRVPGTA